jgi:hypothetical protein
MSRPRRLLPALLCAIAVLVVAGCGDDGGGGGGGGGEAGATDGTTTTTALPEGVGADSPAAALLSDLTTELQANVYLVGETVIEARAADGDLDAPPVVRARATVDANSAALAGTIGTGYGSLVSDQFLPLWTGLVDQLVARGAGGPAPDAELSLEDHPAAITEVLTAADPDLAGEELESALADAVDALAQAVDPPDPAALQDAATESGSVADLLAAALAAELRLEDDTTAPESRLRSDLTALLQESVYLTGLTLTDPAAQGPLAANAESLAEVVAGGDPGLAEDVLQLWNRHLELFGQYAEAAEASNADGLDQAEAALDAWRDDLGAVLAEAYPTLTPEAVAEELVPHVDSVLNAIDAFAEDDPAEVERLHEAAAGTASLARTLALAITAAA